MLGYFLGIFYQNTSFHSAFTRNGLTKKTVIIAFATANAVINCTLNSRFEDKSEAVLFAFSLPPIWSHYNKQLIYPASSN